jgi:hypothetical protein
MQTYVTIDHQAGKKGKKAGAENGRNRSGIQQRWVRRRVTRQGIDNGYVKPCNDPHHAHQTSGAVSMRIRLFPFAVVFLFAPMASSGQEKGDNPYKEAKVGDYVAFKMTTSVMGKDIEMTMKQTVTAKSDTEATVKTAVAFMGTELPGQSTKIDLTKPYDFTAAAMQGKQKGKFEKTGEGKEKLKVGDKTYECTWMSGKVVADNKGMKIESDVKVWFTKAVPLSGLVKMEMKSNLANVQMELSGSGNEK